MSSRETTKNLLKGNTCDNCFYKIYGEWPDHAAYCRTGKTKKILPKSLTCAKHKLRDNDRFIEEPNKVMIETYSEALKKTLESMINSKNDNKAYGKIYEKMLNAFSVWRTKDSHE